MPYSVIASALNRAIGLDAASIGSTALACAVRRRMSARGQPCPNAYAAQVEADASELRALVEAVVVPETWFFREREAFVALADMARQRVGPYATGDKLRLVSLPCSTGEEPYSLAMTLLDAGLPAAAFELHAFDVSRSALERAAAGVYGRNSFRGADLGFRTRHFVETPEGWRIRPEVASCVRFDQANLLEIEAPPAPQAYDFVFCRNLLIYFDTASQQRAIRLLRGLLKRDGVIFAGPGEANLMLGAGLASVQRPLTFAFRETTPAPREAAAKHRVQRRHATAPAGARLQSPVRRAFAQRAPAPAETRPQPEASLADARRLADLGHVAEAIRACEAHLRQSDTSADAWRLLGVLWEAGGEPSRAADCYRRALYLDPMDADSLEHLALLRQRQGDAAGAQRVRERAGRLTAREGR